MRCKICENSFKLSLIPNPETRNVADELQVCGKCQRIIMEKKPNWGKKLERTVTICAICGDSCNHNNTHETCGRSRCRAKWLRLRKQKEIIQESIKTGNYQLLDSMKVTTIQKLGFDCQITSRGNCLAGDKK